MSASEIYDWVVTTPDERRTLSTHGNVAEAFTRKGASDVVFVVLKATGLRVRVLRAG